VPENVTDERMAKKMAKLAEKFSQNEILYSSEFHGQHCIYPGCTEKDSDRLYKGKPHCFIHYHQVLNDEFFNLFDQWEDGTSPPERLNYLLGRLYDEEPFTEIGGYLSGTRVRGRSYDLKKTSNGIQFSITRHPGAFIHFENIERVVETWDVNYVDMVAELINKRKWEEDDPD
jgi:hypothetical protein